MATFVQMKVAIESAPETRLTSETRSENSSNLPLSPRRSLTTVLGFDNNFDNNAGGRPWLR
jgi:hypothetical protein